MKRVKSACIYQTLVFAQREELGFSRASALAQNRDEIARYRAAMDRAGTRYQITDERELEDGSVEIRVRKQYNDRTDVSEYFA